MTTELIDESRSLLDTPPSTHPGLWERAAILLARQALEEALDDFWRARSPDLLHASMRAQLLCLGPLMSNDYDARPGRPTLGRPLRRLPLQRRPAHPRPRRGARLAQRHPAPLPPPQPPGRSRRRPRLVDGTHNQPWQRLAASRLRPHPSSQADNHEPPCTLLLLSFVSTQCTLYLLSPQPPLEFPCSPRKPASRLSRIPGPPLVLVGLPPRRRRPRPPPAPVLPEPQPLHASPVSVAPVATPLMPSAAPVGGLRADTLAPPAHRPPPQHPRPAMPGPPLPTATPPKSGIQPSRPNAPQTPPKRTPPPFPHPRHGGYSPPPPSHPKPAKNAPRKNRRVFWKKLLLRARAPRGVLHYRVG